MWIENKDSWRKKTKANWRDVRDIFWTTDSKCLWIFNSYYEWRVTLKAIYLLNWRNEELKHW